ncbi:hypothetical protein NEPAR08_2210 [Nematocida parisii]|nr:hypothetical protein NEPAR08_2210 [Nematocida parisii]
MIIIKGISVSVFRLYYLGVDSVILCEYVNIIIYKYFYYLCLTFYYNKGCIAHIKYYYYFILEFLYLRKYLNPYRMNINKNIPNSDLPSDIIYTLLITHILLHIIYTTYYTYTITYYTLYKMYYTFVSFFGLCVKSFFILPVNA